MSDEEIREKESEYFDDKHFRHIIKSNVDVYYKNSTGKEILWQSLEKKLYLKNYLH